MIKKIVIGSRGSKLALIYAQIAKDKIIQNTILNDKDILIEKIVTKVVSNYNYFQDISTFVYLYLYCPHM